MLAPLSRRKREISAAMRLEIRGPDMSNVPLLSNDAREIEHDSRPWIDLKLSRSHTLTLRALYPSSYVRIFTDAM